MRNSLSDRIDFTLIGLVEKGSPDDLLRVKLVQGVRELEEELARHQADFFDIPELE